MGYKNVMKPILKPTSPFRNCLDEAQLEGVVAINRETLYEEHKNRKRHLFSHSGRDFPVTLFIQSLHENKCFTFILFYI